MSVKVPDYIQGKDLNIYYNLNGTLYIIAHARDCKLAISTDTQETTTKNTLRGKTFDNIGKYSYKLSCDGITNFLDAPNIAVLQGLIMTGVKVQFVFTDQYFIQYSGTLLITSLDIDSPYAGISIFTHEMMGDGELDIITTNVPPIPLPNQTVNIIDQFGNIIATIIAPGTYSVLRFDTIDLGGATKPPSNLIIMPAS